jgi:putative tryptophan/tyrosine transport system substrate-binding protein
MKRREFIAGLGGAAAWPLAARAQQPVMPVIGFLDLNMRDSQFSQEVRKALDDSGYVEGRTLTIEHRWADDLARLPELAADLVRRRVAVIVAASTASALAAKAATTTIPVVFYAGVDAVGAGLVPNLIRPGGNLTGVNSMVYQVGAKQIGLLHDLLPLATRFGFLINPQVPNIQSAIQNIEGAAVTIGKPIEVLSASTNHEIDTAFATLLEKRVDALVVSPAQLFVNRQVQVVALTLRHGVPTIFSTHDTTKIGGLMSYSVRRAELFRQVALYVVRILKGEKPSELPVVQPTKFELAINLKTPKALGLTVPPTLLALADEVIE